jgi:hypothetical protein
MYAEILNALFFLSVNGHITVNSPAPRAGTTSNPATSFCQGLAAGAPTATVTAGGDLPVSLSVGADHGGGGCVFSLACANELSDPSNPKFKSIFATDKNCPMVKEFTIKIPNEADGNCVLSWGWVPIFSGGPEMYQNCMDITVTGGTGGSLPGQDIGYFNTLNQGKLLTGNNASDKRTLFDEFYQTPTIATFEESAKIANEKNFGIPTGSNNGGEQPSGTNGGNPETQKNQNIPATGTATSTSGDGTKCNCSCTCARSNALYKK